MQPIDALIADARQLADGTSSAACDEASRQLTICNACRYCEGFCAVFPAMTRRIVFDPPTAHYLANLCHNCGACLHACQYAPPHEFAVNIPRALAQVRLQTYTAYAWPAAFGRVYAHHGLALALALAFGLALFLVLAIVRHGALMHAPMAGNFYAVFPHNLMVGLFAPVFLFALLAMGIGVRRFWRDQAPAAWSPAALAEAGHNAATLKYLDGGHKEGCNEADDRVTHWRRRFHHCTAYGFLLCFASTSVATLYHTFLNEQAPYPVLSLPVLLGIVGGAGLLLGPVGLLVLHARRAPLHRDPAQTTLDRGLIVLLAWVSATGLALLAWRDSGAMALLLAVHLGAVMAFFVLMPYGKFAHGLYRGAALLKWAIEKRQTNTLKLADG